MLLLLSLIVVVVVVVVGVPHLLAAVLASVVVFVQLYSLWAAVLLCHPPCKQASQQWHMWVDVVAMLVLSHCYNIVRV